MKPKTRLAKRLIDPDHCEDWWVGICEGEVKMEKEEDKMISKPPSQDPKTIFSCILVYISVCVMSAFPPFHDSRIMYI